MKSKYYGQISLTKLGEIARKQPELVKEITFKDGHKEKLINISIIADETPNQYGKIGAVRVDCTDRKQELNYFVGDLNPSKFTDPPAQQPQPQPAARHDWDVPAQPLDNEPNDDLPF